MKNQPEHRESADARLSDATTWHGIFVSQALTREKKRSRDDNSVPAFICQREMEGFARVAPTCDCLCGDLWLCAS